MPKSERYARVQSPLLKKIQYLSFWVISELLFHYVSSCLLFAFKIKRIFSCRLKNPVKEQRGSNLEFFN